MTDRSQLEDDRDPRVLVVEGNAVIRTLVQHLLAAERCRVDAVSSGPEALERVAEARYDLVLVAAELLDDEGLRLPAELRSRSPAPPPSIVAMAAPGPAEERERQRAAGIHGHLDKPVQKGDLQRVLRTHVAPRVVAADDSARDMPWDPEWLRVRMGCDDEMVRSFVEMYLERGDQLVAAMAAAVGAGDLDALRFHAHALKGISGTIGAKRIHDLLRDEASRLAETLPRIEATYAELRAVLEHELSRA